MMVWFFGVINVFVLKNEEMQENMTQTFKIYLNKLFSMYLNKLSSVVCPINVEKTAPNCVKKFDANTMARV